MFTCKLHRVATVAVHTGGALHGKIQTTAFFCAELFILEPGSIREALGKAPIWKMELRSPWWSCEHELFDSI